VAILVTRKQHHGAVAAMLSVALHAQLDHNSILATAAKNDK